MIMAKYQKARDYCKETGFPIRSMMEKIVHCKEGQECCFRTTSGKTAPWYLDVDKFEKKFQRGDFREVLEG